MERGEVLRQRAFMLNVEKLKPVMTRDELRAATVRKPPLLDQMRM
jgi:hypothetical protein